MTPQHIIWPHENCISREQLIAYREGKLAAEELRIVEEHVIDCPLCSDAFDALMLHETPVLVKELNEIHIRNPYVSSDMKPSDKTGLKVVSRTHNKGAKKRNWWWAAAAALFMGLGAYSVYSIVYEEKNTIAKNTEVPTDETKKGTYSDKNKEVNEEIVQLNVPLDSTLNLADDNKEIKAKPSATKSKETIVAANDEKSKIIVSAPEIVSKNESKSSNIEESNVASTIEPPSPVSDNNEAPIKNSDVAYQDYNAAPKLESEREEVLSKKKSSIGLKKDNARNVSPVTSNQMSYPANKDNNNYQSNIEVLNSVKEEKRIADYDEGMKAFNERDYAKSITYLERALAKAKRREYDDIAYHLAEAYMKVGNTSKAEALYQKLASSKKYGTEARKRLPASKK